MAPHLQRCQGLAVADYSFPLGRLEAEVPSTFAHLGYYHSFLKKIRSSLIARVSDTTYSSSSNGPVNCPSVVHSEGTTRPLIKTFSEGFGINHAFIAWNFSVSMMRL